MRSAWACLQVLRALEHDEEYEELEDEEMEDVIEGGVLEWLPRKLQDFALRAFLRPESLLWGPVDNDRPVQSSDHDDHDLAAHCFACDL